MAMSLMAICAMALSGSVLFEEPGWQAAWVWGSKHMDQGPGYFRMTFEVKPGLERAVLQTSGDDSYDLFVNGRKIAHGGFSYGHTDSYDITDKLRAGKNVVAAVCWNGAFPGGWLAELALIYGRGPVQIVASGEQVRFAAEEHQGWTRVDFDDSGWEKARVVARPPKGVWGPLPHDDYAHSAQLEVLEVSVPEQVRAGESFPFAIKVRPREPIKDDVGLVAEITAFGRPFPIARLAPDPPTSQWQPGRVYRLSTTASLSKFFPSMDTQLSLRMARCVLGKHKAIVRDLRVQARVKPHRTPARVARWQGSPIIELKVDGRWQPQAPYIFAGSRLIESYWQAPRLARVRIVQCTLNVPYGWWVGHKPNYRDLDLALVKVLTWCPEAYVLPRIGVTPPGKWCDEHPQECLRFADGTGWVADVFGGTKHQSFASELWRKEAAEGLRRLIRHVQSMPYAERIIGYHVASGIYGEWHLWAPGHLPDVSEPLRRRFVRWCRDKYDSLDALNRAWGRSGEKALRDWGQIQCPDIPAREASDLGMFKDLSRSRYVADYWQCLHETTAEAIGNLARVVKEETQGEGLCGAFYGYITDLGWAQEGGHLAVSKHLGNPDIDFLCSPHSYSRREPGMDAGFRAYPRSIRLHGKIFIDENDDRTYLTTAADGLRHVDTREATINLMRRGLANALGNRCGEWLFDLSGGWFADRGLAREMAQQRRIFEDAVSTWRDAGAAQTAVVCSPESFLSLADWKTHKDQVDPGLFSGEYQNFYRMGAPFDTVLADDVGAEGLPRYKVWVLLNCFYLTDARRRRWAQLLRDAVVVAAYAPGFSSDSGLSEEHLADLMGMRVRVQREGGSLRVRVTPEGARLLGLKAGQTLGLKARQAPRFVILPGAAARGWRGEVVSLGEYEDGGGCGLGALVVGGKVRRLYSACAALPPELLRAALRAADAPIWLDSPDVFYCNPPYLGVHASTDGIKHLFLPQPWSSATVIDAFSGRVLWKEEGGRIDLQMRRGETVLGKILDEHE